MIVTLLKLAALPVMVGGILILFAATHAIRKFDQKLPPFTQSSFGWGKGGAASSQP